MTNIWTLNGNRVAALAPGPGDLFVVTTTNGVRLAVQPIDEYGQAVATANAFAGQVKHPIKVQGMSLRELLAFMGMSEAQFIDGMAPEVEQEFKQLAVDACMKALRDCNDPAVRADALRVLTGMGVMPAPAVT